MPAIVIMAVFGSIVGSFLNVCIYRIPGDRSIILPRSYCPHCGQTIKFYDNIPVLSYLMLMGRCRTCKARISLQYPAVELITASLSAILFWRYGLSLQYLATFVFTCSLIVITFIDLEHQIIPDVITLPGIPLFFLAAVFIMKLRLIDVVLGIIIGGGILYLIAFAYELLRKTEGMGGGDIKLLAMIGAFLGWQSLWFIVMVSSILGAVIGITAMVIQKEDMKYAIPFGPFLSVGAVSYLFFGSCVTRLLFLR
ncbi:MAG: prepilin peptidase [Deltaproteobacteria bacterium]|nr:prepilin peptidase [Deltaproteobacteria bacterium]MBN2687353.1 prepilin peptidase [Deltaproteobacteria bacterium]